MEKLEAKDPDLYDEFYTELKDIKALHRQRVIAATQAGTLTDQTGVAEMEEKF